jgi:hypothetical protein
MAHFTIGTYLQGLLLGRLNPKNSKCQIYLRHTSAWSQNAMHHHPSSSFIPFIKAYGLAANKVFWDIKVNIFILIDQQTFIF